MSKVNEYRGYTWTSVYDLSEQLYMAPTYVNSMQRLHKGWTVYDVIDFALTDDKKTFRREHDNTGKYQEYRGFKWRSMSELSEQMGAYRGYVAMMLRRNKSLTAKDVIDIYLDHPEKGPKSSRPRQEHRGYTWLSDTELSIALGYCRNYVKQMLMKHPDWTKQDIIDYVIEKERRM